MTIEGQVVLEIIVTTIATSKVGEKRVGGIVVQDGRLISKFLM
jgi:hypothetical protein